MKDVIFVNDKDEIIGGGSIEEAVTNGYAVRISRVLLVNNSHEVLLQQRGKNIWNPLQWNESATGHVDVGETYLEAALRELKEEIGVTDVVLKEIGVLYHEHPFKKGGMKKNFHTLFLGMYNGTCRHDPIEVETMRWVPQKEAQTWIQNNPEEFAPAAVESLEVFFQKF